MNGGKCFRTVGTSNSANLVAFQVQITDGSLEKTIQKVKLETNYTIEGMAHYLRDIPSFGDDRRCTRADVAKLKTENYRRK